MIREHSGFFIHFQSSNPSIESLHCIENYSNFGQNLNSMNSSEFIAQSEKVNDRKSGFLFFAPGRVNLMGDYTDFTGGFVLPAAIRFGTYLSVRLTSEKVLRFSSENMKGNFEIPFSALKNRTQSWVDYPLGVMNELMSQGWKPQGMELTYFGDIPTGAGLSSSASIEMVTAFAINRIYGLNLTRKELALLSQRAENNFVGVMCGLMDQYAVGLGEHNKALLIDCHEITHKTVKIPFEAYRFVIINTNKKRELLHSAYNRRVEELRTIKERLNSYFEVPYLGALTGEDSDWLDKIITDETLVKRLRHVVNENTRVRLSTEYIATNQPEKFGELMFRSHESLAYDFEVSCRELDTLVSIASKTEGVAGARMTGAGFGGCTINLVRQEAVDTFAQKATTEYNKKTGLHADVYPIEIIGELRQF